jgi:hypothetical protein
METTSLIQENKQELVDSANMREEILRKALKEQNYPPVLSYTCNCCWNVMRIQRRVLSKPHVQYLICLRDMQEIQGLDKVHHDEIKNRTYKMYGRNVSDYPILFHLGLMRNTDTDGYFEITQKGLDFLAGKCKVIKSYYQVPNSDILIMGSKMISVLDILKF